MRFFRVVLTALVGGALLGLVAAGSLGPRFIAWDNTPGSAGPAACVCSAAARAGAEALVRYALRGGATGAVLGAGAGTALGLWLRQRRARQAVTAAT